MPDGTSQKVREESDGKIFSKISGGRGTTPPWKHLAKHDRGALMPYIRSFGGV